MKNKILILIAVIAIGFTFTSCEDFLDVNTDPNNPTEVSPDLVLPVGQMYTARWMQEDRGVNHLGNMMMYNWSEAYGFSWYDEEFKYLVTSTFYDDIWDDSYTDALKMYADLDDLGAEGANYVAIAKIMKSYTFQILVDFYGDIPYSQALKRGDNSTPTYDDAEDIYKALIADLTAAIDMIHGAEGDATVTLVGEDDVMFQGDMTEWIRFANTIKIRILNRYASVAGNAYVTEQLTVINNEGTGYITNDVTINPGYDVQENQQNPIWDDLGWDISGAQTLSSQATCATQYILDYLTGTADGRISFIYEEPATGHLGVNQGLDVGQEFGTDLVSNIGPGILKSATMDAVIFTLAEHNFNMAEMALNGFVTGAAATYYDAGVTASFNYLGAGDATGYLSSNSYTSWTNPLEGIITQKWIATNGITAEQSWFDYNRTGYPSNLPISNQASTADRPVRLYYPSSEITGNTANVPDQPNAFTSKIFWAQ